MKIVGIDGTSQNSVLEVSDNVPILVGGASDGAAVNIARTKGNVARCSTLAILILVLCSSIRTCLQTSIFPVHYILRYRRCFSVYTICTRSLQKQSKKLENIVENLNEVFDLPKGGNLPFIVRVPGGSPIGVRHFNGFLIIMGCTYHISMLLLEIFCATY